MQTIAPLPTDLKQPRNLPTPLPEARGAVTTNIPVLAADEILSIVAREISSRESLGQSVSPALRRAYTDMHVAAETVFDEMIVEAFGCISQIGGQNAAPLSQAVYAGTIDGDVPTVFIPGRVDYVEAVTVAVGTLLGKHVSIDLDDPNVAALVSPARWMVLHPCSAADHDFHPVLAADGQNTVGAVLVTRVDFDL